MKNIFSKKIVLIIVFLLVGACLGVFATSSFLKSEYEIKNIEFLSKDALRNPLIDRISFVGTGKIKELNENQIIIEGPDNDDTLTAMLEDDVRVFLFSHVDFESDEPSGPKAISLNDIELGEEVSVFGREESRDTLVVESITVTR